MRRLSIATTGYLGSCSSHAQNSREENATAIEILVDWYKPESLNPKRALLAGKELRVVMVSLTLSTLAILEIYIVSRLTMADDGYRV